MYENSPEPQERVPWDVNAQVASLNNEIRNPKGKCVTFSSVKVGDQTPLSHSSKVLSASCFLFLPPLKYLPLQYLQPHSALCFSLRKTQIKIDAARIQLENYQHGVLKLVIGANNLD